MEASLEFPIHFLKLYSMSWIKSLVQRMKSNDDEKA